MKKEREEITKSKSIYQDILKLIIIVMLVLSFQMISIHISQATERTIRDLPIAYEEWLKIPDSKKSEYIEPLPFSVTYDNKSDLYQKSRLKMYDNLKSTYQSSYSITGMKVKDQKETQSCWAFSTTSLIESNIAKVTEKESPELSPRHMEYATAKTFLDGINPYGYNREIGSGGNAYLGLYYCTSGRGPVLESDMPFQNNENRINLAEIQNKTPATSIDEYTVFPSIFKEYSAGATTYHNGYSNASELRVEYSNEDVQTIRNSIKGHIIEHGAISSSTFIGEEADIKKYFNTSKVAAGTTQYYAYNCDDNSLTTDHAITIVGWDDNFSADNFNDGHKPKSNGAYIVLNSYGADIFNDGYIYISYEDAFIERSLAGVIKTSDIDYDKIYQHDPLGFNFEFAPESTTGQNFSSVYGGNVFERDNTKQETLSEISFYINSTTNVQVYANGESGELSEIKLVKNMGTLEPGYYTCKLDTPISLTGEKFAVVLKYSADVATIPLECDLSSNDGESSYWDTATSKRGESLISVDGQTWLDMADIGTNTNICIKAFTNYEKDNTNVDVESVGLNISNKTISVGDEISLVATVLPTNATNKNVTWTSSNTDVATVDSNGKVTAKAEGTTTITVTTVSGTKQATCTITVQPRNEEENKITKITLNTTSKTLYVGGNFQLIATITPDSMKNKPLEWESSDTSIATVDEDGIVRGISKGITTITVKNVEDDISESCVVTVLDKEEDKNTEDDIVIDNNNQSDTTIKPIKPNGNGDTTTAEGTIPQAGVNIFILIVVIAVTTIGVICFIQLRRAKDIK